MGVRRSLLVVEDCEAHIRALTGWLHKLDPQLPVKIARSAPSAVRMLERRDEFVAAILDYSLEEGTGLEVLEEIRRRGSTMPVMVLTGHLKHAIIIRCQALDAYYVLKPFEKANLVALLAKARDAACSRTAGNERPRRLEEIIPLGSLTPRQRDALVIRLRTPSDQAAADELGVSLSTLRAHLREARIRLGKSLAEVRALLGRAQASE